MQTPSSHPPAPSAWIRRAAYGAPDAPVIPRKTCTDLLRALGGLEEGRDLPELAVGEGGERRHRRAGVDAARALEVRDLELDPLVLRALGGQPGGPEVRRARAEVGVAVEAARRREQPRARNRVRRQLL